MAAHKIQRIQFEKRILKYALLMIAPPIIVCLILLNAGNFSAKVWITSLVFISAVSFIYLRWLLRSIFRPIQSASNLVSAIREGDYSMQSRPSSTRDSLGELYFEINRLTQDMDEKHQQAVEAEVLLRGLMNYIDIAVFAFDGSGKITLVNHAACELLNADQTSVVDRHASTFKLEKLLVDSISGPVSHTFPARSGRWSVRKSEFRENGVPHTLMLLQDVSRSLRDEERSAWKRLIRVMGHELNNSLAPIRSISETLNTIISRTELEGEFKEDLEDGLGVIQKRAAALSRFVDDYSKIAKLPPPTKRRFMLNECINSVSDLQDFKGKRIQIISDEELAVLADEAQIEQLLINLTKNAIEANQPTNGNTSISITGQNDKVLIDILDEGVGLASTENLFIPFYSTKPGGSGIGLTLSQQIAENHGGALELKNRDDRKGCLATVTLPILDEKDL